LRREETAERLMVDWRKGHKEDEGKEAREKGMIERERREFQWKKGKG